MSIDEFDLKPKIVIQWWIIGAGILLLCLGLLLGWRVGVLDGSNMVGTTHCFNEGRHFIRVEKDYTINCSSFTYRLDGGELLPLD